MTYHVRLGAVGHILLRDFINATCGFPALAVRLGMVDKSLMRAFSKKEIRGLPPGSRCCIP